MRIAEKLAVCLLMILMLASGGWLLHYGLNSLAERTAYRKLEETVFAEKDTSDTENDQEESENNQESGQHQEEGEFQYQMLKAQNPDCVGWIQIQGMDISYPVMQAKDNDYYLHRGFDQKYAAGGSIFLDYRNDIHARQEHLILYGHQMKDGSMFKQMNDYKKEKFYREHKDITLYLEEERYQYQVAAVYVTNVGRSGDYYNYIHRTTRKQQMEYLKQMAAYQLYETDVTVSESDELLSLSTCEYSSQDGRLIVLAVRSVPAKTEE